MILILILALIIITIAAFVVLPGLLNLLVDSYDEWKQVFERIRRRFIR